MQQMPLRKHISSVRRIVFFSCTLRMRQATNVSRMRSNVFYMLSLLALSVHICIAVSQLSIVFSLRMRKISECYAHAQPPPLSDKRIYI
jgi:hypothetical protein